MAKRVILWVVILSVAILAVGCSTNSDYTQKNSQEVRNLKSKIYLLENDLISINSRLDEFDQQKVSQPKSNDDSALMGQLSTDINYLKSQIEFQGNRITTLLEAAESDAEAILSLQEKLNGKKGSPRRNYTKTKTQSSEVTPEFQYSSAKKLYDANSLDAALVKFNDFLKSFPRHKLAANAQYWVGEIYYDIDNYSKAILEFEKVERNYPESLKAPDAKFKVAMSQIKLDEKQEATKTLNDLKRFYPDYERMSKVDQFLKSLQ